MMTDAAAQAHPAPHRGRVGSGMLLLGVFGAPAAWLGQLVLNYYFASYSCYPDGAPLHEPLAGWKGIWWAILAANIVAILVSLATAWLSLENWRRTRHEDSGAHHEVVEIGEGRTRYLALCGALTGFGFLVALLFDTVVLSVVPQCIG